MCTKVLRPFTTPHSCTNPVPSKCWKFMITRLDRPLERSRTSKMLSPSALQLILQMVNSIVRCREWRSWVIKWWRHCRDVTAGSLFYKTCFPWCWSGCWGETQSMPGSCALGINSSVWEKISKIPSLILLPLSCEHTMGGYQCLAILDWFFNHCFLSILGGF